MKAKKVCHLSGNFS
ncbi:unnamed protein product [Callosobruchus maculatus]|nr:unnamed protein product [Callosobruchus maculatus]